jgi:hypothetical protein
MALLGLEGALKHYYFIIIICDGYTSSEPAWNLGLAHVIC